MDNKIRMGINLLIDQKEGSLCPLNIRSANIKSLPTSYPLLIIEKWLSNAAFGFPVVPDEN